MRILLNVILLILLISSCRDSYVSEDKQVINNEINFTINYDTIVHNDNNSTSFQLFSVFDNCDTVVFYYKFNNKNLIQRISYFNQSVLHKDSFVLSGKYGNNISSMAVINFDSLILFEQNEVRVISFTNPLCDFKYFHSDLDTSFLFLQDVFQDVVYNSTNNSFRTSLVRYDKEDIKNHDSDIEFAAEVNISTRKMTILNAKYSSDFKTSKRFHANAFMLTSNNMDFYMSISGISNKILKWSITNDGNIEEFDIVHKSYQPIIELDRVNYGRKDMQNRNLSVSFIYNGFVYDHNNELFYRFFDKQMEEYTDDGYKKTWGDKVFGVNVFNDDFSYNEEVVFGKRKYIYSLNRFFISKVGIIALKNRMKNKFVITRIKLDINHEN